VAARAALAALLRCAIAWLGMANKTTRRQRGMGRRIRCVREARPRASRPFYKPIIMPEAGAAERAERE